MTDENIDSDQADAVKPSAQFNPAYQLALWQIMLAVIPVAIIAIFISQGFDGKPIRWETYSEAKLKEHIAGEKTVLLYCYCAWSENAWYADNYVLNTLRVKRWVRANKIVTMKYDTSNFVTFRSKKHFTWPQAALVLIPEGDLDNIVVLDGRVTVEDLLAAGNKID